MGFVDLQVARLLQLNRHTVSVKGNCALKVNFDVTEISLLSCV